MSLKPIAFTIISWLALCIQGFSQYQTTTNSGLTPVEIVVSAGQVMQVFSFMHQGGVNPSNLSFDDGVVNKREFTSKSHEDAAAYDAKQMFFVGPGKVILTGTFANSVARLTYKISDNSTVAGYIPSNAIVVPENASGPVSVILESSTDLVTWTAAMPGTYNSSTSKRFFRVRAVAQ